MLTKNLGVKFIDSEFPSGIRPGEDLVEIFGASSSGKTELLLNIAANCIAPVRIENIEIGGMV